MLQTINQNLLTYFNSFTEINFIKESTILMSDFPILFLPIFLLWAWIFYSYKEKNKSINIDNKKSELLFIFYSTILAVSISIIIQQFVNIERPEEYLKNSETFILYHLPTASFPSDHASVSFAFITSLFLTNYKKIAFSFLPFVIIMNLSRIITWVHWPFDIIAWTIIWILSWFIIFKLLKNNKYINNLNNFIIKMLKYIKL